MGKPNKLFDNRIWLTTREASEYLRLSENAFRIFVSRYSVPRYVLGAKSVRYKASDLDRLMTLTTKRSQ